MTSHRIFFIYFSLKILNRKLIKIIFFGNIYEFNLEKLNLKILTIIR